MRTQFPDLDLLCSWNRHYKNLVSCSDRARDCIQAHDTHADLWDPMQAHGPACKLIYISAHQIMTGMQAYITAHQILNWHASLCTYVPAPGPIYKLPGLSAGLCSYVQAHGPDESSWICELSGTSWHILGPSPETANQLVRPHASSWYFT